MGECKLFCSIMHPTPSFFFLITEVSGRAVMQALIFNLTDHHTFIFPFDKSAIPRRLAMPRGIRAELQKGAVMGGCVCGNKCRSGS